MSLLVLATGTYGIERQVGGTALSPEQSLKLLSTLNFLSS